MKAKRRKSCLLSVAAVALLLLPLAALAGNDNDNQGFGVSPFHFGQGGLATWERDAGEPGQKGDPK